MPTMAAEHGKAKTGLLLPAVLFLLAAVALDVVWLSRRPLEGGGMVLGMRRLGLMVALSPGEYAAFAVVAVLAGMGCVVASFLLARRARGCKRPACTICAPSATNGPLVATSVVRGGSVGRLVAAFVVLVASALPLHHLLGWLAGGIRPVVKVGAEWERVSFFKHLGGSAVGFFWLAAALSVGAHLLLTRWRWPSGAIARWAGKLASMRRPVVVLLAASLVAVAAAGFSLRFLGGGPYFPDAGTYYFQAKAFAAGRLSSPLYGGREFFDPEWESSAQASAYVFLGDRWFSVGLPGAPWLFAVGMWLGCPWLVAPLLGAGVVVFTYLLAREVLGEEVALIALPLAALSPWLIVMSADYANHVPCTLAMVVFLWSAFRAMDRASWLLAAVAGLALGVGAAIRPPTALALCLPMAAAWGAWLVRRPRESWRPTLAFAVALALPLAGLLAYNAATTGSATTFAYQVVWGGPEVAGRHNYRFADWRWQPVNGLSNLWEMLFWLNTAVFRWPVPVVGVLAAATVLLGVGDEAKPRRRLLLLALAGLALLLTYARWEDVQEWMGGPRYVFEILPLLVVLTAAWLHCVWRGLVHMGASEERVRALLVVGVLVFFGAGALTMATTVLPGHLERARGIQRLFRAVEAGVERPALVFVPVGADQRFVARFHVVVARNDPALLGAVVYARDSGADNRKLATGLPGQRNCYRWDDGASRLVRLAPDGVTELRAAAPD